jgi:hypothetical protein
MEANMIGGEGTERSISILQAQDVQVLYNELFGCRQAIAADYSNGRSIHDNTSGLGQIRDGNLLQ